MRELIIVHAFYRDAQGEHYADPKVDPVDGWTAYHRVPVNPSQDDGQFDIPWEEVFPTREAAYEAGAARADRFGIDLCVED